MEMKQATQVQIVADTALTPAEFRGLAQVPPEAEWFANLDSA